MCGYGGTKQAWRVRSVVGFVHIHDNGQVSRSDGISAARLTRFDCCKSINMASLSCHVLTYVSTLSYYVYGRARASFSFTYCVQPTSKRSQLFVVEYTYCSTCYVQTVSHVHSVQMTLFSTRVRAEQLYSSNTSRTKGKYISEVHRRNAYLGRLSSYYRRHGTDRCR